MTALESLLPCLEAMLGSTAVDTAEAHTAAFAIGHRAPSVVVRPDSVEQAAEVIALAGRERLAVVPWGQGTQMHLGKIPLRYDLALVLTGLRRIVDYDRANLTIVAEAGLSLREVYRLSIPERQFLPLGFPGSKASLGGVLVTNTSGVKRLRYGALRDVLLGVRVGLPDGSRVRFGGRVVKNVAGYDMNKLFVGSLGAFGVVLETTYRLVALPEDDRALAVLFPTLAQAVAAAAAVQGSQLLPSALVLLPAETVVSCPPLSALDVEAPQAVLVMNVDGTVEAVARQLRDARTLSGRHGMLAEMVLSGDELLTFWEFQDAWRLAPADTDQEWVQIRLGTLPSHVEAAVQSLVDSPSADQPPPCWLADYSNGQVFARRSLATWPGTTLTSAVQDWLYRLRLRMRHLAGYGVVEYAPTTLRQALDMWGEAPGYALLQRYKQRFDPHAVLNPGRYVADL